MTLLPDGIGGLLVPLIGRVLGGPAAVIEAAFIAAVSTGQTLLQMFGWVGLAEDLGRWKEAKLAKLEAEARLKRAEADKTEAEAYAIRIDAETRRQSAG